jgi:hypothetical protein
MIRHARGKDASHPASPSGERAASGRQVDYTYQIRSFRRFAKIEDDGPILERLICPACHLQWLQPQLQGCLGSTHQRGGKAEKHPPRPSGSPGEARTAARTASRRARDTAHLLGDLLNWLARPLASTAWRGKKSALPLCSLVMMRGRDPGDRPDHRGRGQGLSESGLIFDLAGHGICLLSAFHGHRRAKGPTTDLRCRDAAAKLVLAHAVGALGFSLTPARAHARQERACIVS